MWATGYRPDLSWLDVAVFDRKGRVLHDGGVTPCPGLYLIGMPFLRRRKSSLIDGAAPDAAELTTHLAGHLDTLAGQRRKDRVMNEHPRRRRDRRGRRRPRPARLAAAVTDTVRLRALLPGGPIEAHGRDAVVARFGGWFADFDTVELVESAGEAVADRLLIHYRLDLAQRGTRWACTQTAICKIVDGRLAIIDLLCSGFREI